MSRRSKSAAKTQNELIENIQDLNIDIEKRAIYVYDEIDTESAKQFVQNLDFLNKTEGLIHVYFNTPGGSWVDGMAMFSAIRLSKNLVIGHIYGDCSSMGSIIIQACKTRIATAESEMMVHPGSSYANKDSKSFINQGAHEADILERMYRIYWDRIPDSKKKKLKYKAFKAKFAHDIYLTAEKALTFGFIDEII